MFNLLRQVITRVFSGTPEVRWLASVVVKYLLTTLNIQA